MTKRQRLALSSMLVSASAMSAYSKDGWFLFAFTAAFLVASYYFTRD